MMSAACRDESDVQLAGSNRSLAGSADVTATLVAWFKTTAAPRAEQPFGAVSTVTPRTATADQNGGYRTFAQGRR